MAATTLRVSNVMTADGAPANGIHPTDDSPDTALATVGYINQKLSGVASVDSNVSNLTTKLLSLQTQLNTIQSTALTRAQYGSLKDQFTTEIAGMIANTDGSSSVAVATLQGQLQQANANITVLNNRNQNLSNQLQALTNEKTALEEALSVLRGQLADGTATGDQLQAYVQRATQAEANNATLQQQLATLTAERAKLSSEKILLEERISILEEQLASGGLDSAQTAKLLKEKQELQARIAELEEQVASLSARIQALTAENTELTNDNNALRARVAELEAQLGSGQSTQPDKTDTGSSGTGGGSTRPGQTTVGGIEII